MKNPIRLSCISALVLATLFLCLSSCEELMVDPDNLNEAELNGNTIYVRSGSSAVIDISSKISTTQQVKFSITSSTNKGDLYSLGGGLLQYSPDQGVANARDAFSYTLTNKNNVVIKQDSVVIVLESDSTNLPEGIYPADDIVFDILPNGTVTIDVLANDILASNKPGDFNVSIYRPDPTFPPYAGAATISGNLISYTAQASFKEADKIVYKLELKTDPTVVAFGLVYLTSAKSCVFTLGNDVLVSDEAFTQLRIPVLDNDQLCSAVNSYNVVVSKQPVRGRAYIESGIIVYEPSSTAENGFRDSLQYKVTIDGVSRTAGVVVGVHTSPTAICQLTAIGDSIDLRNSTAFSVTIDVLQNDVLCNLNVILEIESAPYFGTAAVVTDGSGGKRISYVPDPQKRYDDKIIYRISAGEKSSLGEIAIERVD